MAENVVTPENLQEEFNRLQIENAALREKLRPYEIAEQQKNTLIGHCLELVLKNGVFQDNPEITPDERDLINKDIALIKNYMQTYSLDHITFSVLMEVQSKELLRLIALYADILTRDIQIDFTE